MQHGAPQKQTHRLAASQNLALTVNTKPDQMELASFLAPLNTKTLLLLQTTVLTELKQEIENLGQQIKVAVKISCSMLSHRSASLRVTAYCVLCRKRRPAKQTQKNYWRLERCAGMGKGRTARLVQQRVGLSACVRAQATEQTFAKELESLQAAVAEKDTQGSSLQKQIKLLQVLGHNYAQASCQNTVPSCRFPVED